MCGAAGAGLRYEPQPARVASVYESRPTQSANQRRNWRPLQPPEAQKIVQAIRHSVSQTLDRLSLGVEEGPSGAITQSNVVRVVIGEGCE